MASKRLAESNQSDFYGDDQRMMADKDHQNTCYEDCLECCGLCSGFLKIWCPCICCCCSSPIYQLQTSKLGIIQTFGRFKSIIEPGLHIINPVTQTVNAIDMKTMVLKLAPQQVITKNNVSIVIDTVVYYRIINPFKLAYELGNNFGKISAFIGELSFSALRIVVGEHMLQELLQNRTRIASQLLNYVKNDIIRKGLFIENIFIKDLVLNPQTKRNLQSAAIQRRVSEANLISAEAEVQAAKMLKETSEILNSSSAMQIRYLETIQSMISSNSSKTLLIGLKGTK